MNPGNQYRELHEATITILTSRTGPHRRRLCTGSAFGKSSRNTNKQTDQHLDRYSQNASGHQHMAQYCQAKTQDYLAQRKKRADRHDAYKANSRTLHRVESGKHHRPISVFRNNRRRPSPTIAKTPPTARTGYMARDGVKTLPPESERLSRSGNILSQSI